MYLAITYPLNRQQAFKLLNSIKSDTRKIDKYKNNLSFEELGSLKSLMRNINIVIQKTDKGNTVAIIDKEKHIQGVKNVNYKL